MRRHHLATVLAAAFLAMMGLPGFAQTDGSADTTATDAAATDASTSADTADSSDALLSDDELDKLVGPIALFPDSLLTQVMMASTYPLDVVKADRFLRDNPDMKDKDRADAAQTQSWDPSVQTLTAGFPDIVSRMADNVDWTEQMGDAVLSQTDDVLDSVQRLREQAKANGYLESNDAQTVEVTNDNTIVVQPADPQVVYVPTYDSNVVYTQTAPANPVYIDDGTNWGNAIATGAIVFGTAMILDDIFDNDDPWDNYWRGPPVIDWDDGDFYPRPRGINVNGDVNINNDRFTNIDRDRINNINRDNFNGGDRVNIGNGNVKNRIGDLDRDQLDRKFNDSFQPNSDKRAAAKAKIENRKTSGEGVANLRDGNGAGLGAGAGAGAGALAGKLNKPSGEDLAKLKKPNAGNLPKVNKPDAGNLAKINKPNAGNVKINKPANVSRPNKPSRPTNVKRPSNASAMQRTGGARAAAASHRGHASAGKLRR